MCSCQGSELTSKSKSSSNSVSRVGQFSISGATCAAGAEEATGKLSQSTASAAAAGRAEAGPASGYITYICLLSYEHEH